MRVRHWVALACVAAAAALLLARRGTAPGDLPSQARWTVAYWTLLLFAAMAVLRRRRRNRR